MADTKKTTVLATALCVMTSSIHAQTLEFDFGDLFERCRTSIEASIPFDTSGLEATEVAKRHERAWGTVTEQEGWSSEDSELYVVLTEWISRDGPKRHLCDIYLKDGERTLDASKQGLLLRQFLVMQTQLIGAGSHEVDKSLSPIPPIPPIPPILNAAFLLSTANPRGCSVTNTLAISPDGTFFSAGSGEKATKHCEIR